jgi:hypothetical protein
MRGRPPQSATSRHYAEPIQANGGDYDELDGDYEVADDEEPFPSARAALQRRQDDQPPTPRSGGSVEKKVSWAEDEEETQAERDATTVFHAELDVDFRETKDRCDAAEAAAEYAEELAAETAHAMDTVLAMAQGRIDEAHNDIDKLEKELAAEKAARRAEQEALLEELVQARRLLVAADKRAGDSRSTIRDERHLDDAIQRLSLLQWLGDGEWTGHNQVEGPPTLSGPVEGYASPEHRQQQAQARRAAAARVAAQREDSSDLAPEHPTRITPRNRSSTGSSRSDLIPDRMNLGTAPRTSTGSGDHLARFETGDY